MSQSHHNMAASGRRLTAIILLCAVLAAEVFWALDSLLLAYVFRHTTFLEAAFYAEPYSLYHRLLVVVIALGLGLFAQSLVRRRQEAQQERDRLFELSTDLFCVLDSNGRFHQINPAWENILGWDQQDISGQDWIQFVHPDDTENAEYTQQSLNQGETVEDVELRFRSATGDYKWILLTGAATKSESRAYLVGHDITYRREAEQSMESARDKMEHKFRQRSDELYQAYQQMEQSEQFYSGLLTSVTVPLIVADRRLAIRMVNDPFCNLMGCTKGELVDDCSLHEVFVAKERNKLEEYHQRCLNNPDTVEQDVEFTIRGKDENEHKVLLNMSATPEKQMVVYTILPRQ